MSGPNKSYDPVEVATLRPAALEAAVTEALRAFAAADSLESLKAARLAHQGDTSALSLANREIGALPPTARMSPRTGTRRLQSRSCQARQTRTCRHLGK